MRARLAPAPELVLVIADHTNGGTGGSRHNSHLAARQLHLRMLAGGGKQRGVTTGTANQLRRPVCPQSNSMNLGSFEGKDKMTFG